MLCAAVLCVRLPLSPVPAVYLTLFCACVCVFISLRLLLRAGTVATKDSYMYPQQSAVCAEHPMVTGAHYVEMTLLEKGQFGA
eukprot:COSAG06_NODE_49877_length_322_cov_1.152466_1_plen_82_part_10